MSDTIEKVINIKSIGGTDTYRTLDGINQLFIQMKANKQAIGDFNIGINVSQINTANKGFVELIDSNKDLIVQVRQLTTEIAKLGQIGSQMVNSMASAMGKTNMATIQNIAGFRQFQGIISSTNLTAGNYIAILSTLNEKSRKLDDTIKDNAAAAIQLRKAFNDGVISQEEYAAGSQQIRESQVELKAELQAIAKEITTLNTLWASSAEKAQESNAKAALNSVQAQQQARMMKLQAVAANSLEGSVAGARAQIALLNREQERLVVVQKEGVSITEEEIAANIKRRDEIIEEKNALHEFIKANADANLSRILNIGNYPTLASEFAAIKVQMQQMVIAGEAGSEAYKRLETRALELSAAMKEVAASTNASTTAGNRFMSIVERMGLRMLASLVIFQAAMEVFEVLKKEWQDTQNVVNATESAMAASAKETTNNFSQEAAQMEALRARFEDLNSSENDRLEIVDQLNEKYGNQIDKITGINDAEKFFVDKSDAFIEALNLRAQAQAALNVITQQYQKQLEAMSDPTAQLNWFNKVGAATSAFFKTDVNAYKQLLGGGKAPSLGDEYDWEKTIRAAGKVDQVVQGTNDQIAFLLKQFTELQNAANKLDEKYHFNTEGKAGKEKKEKQPKEAHDYTDERLKDEKQLTDLIAKEVEARLQLEMNEQKEIADNTHRSLSERLAAYAIYARDLKSLIKLQSDAQIKDVQDKLNVISDIEQAQAAKKAGQSYNKGYFDKNGNLRPEEEKLLLSKEALTKQIDVVVAETAVKTQQAEATINRDIAGIVNSGVSTMLGEITQELNSKIADIESRANAARDKVYGSGKSEGRQTKGITKIDDQESIDKDIANISANSKEQDQLEGLAAEEHAQAAHNAQMEMLEQQHLDKLKDLRNKSAVLQTQLQNDQHKQALDNEAENKKVQDAVKEQSLEAFSQIGNAFIQMLQEQEEANERHAQSQLDWTKKLMDSQAQSKQQEMANEKAAYLAQQQLDKEKMINQRRIAEAQMAIDFATGVMKIWASNADDPVLASVETAGLTATYTAKLATMNAVQYAEGGEVPSSGGVFGGKSHAHGGTPFFFAGGRFEAEAGELAIINKRSSGSNATLSVTGTPKQIASAVNAHGGGLDFAPGARMHRFEYGGLMGAQVQPPQFIADHYARQALNSMSGNSGITELHMTMIAHNETMTSAVDAINSRIDRLQVHVSAKDVSDAQNKTNKTVKIGTL